MVSLSVFGSHSTQMPRFTKGTNYAQVKSGANHAITIVRIAGVGIDGTARLGAPSVIETSAIIVE